MKVVIFNKLLEYNIQNKKGQGVYKYDRHYER